MNLISPQNDFPEWNSLLNIESNNTEKKLLADNTLYIHDFSGKSYYSINWSLKELIENGISNKKSISTSPAKDFATILQQIATTICCLQNECSGIQTIRSFDTLLAPYIKNANLSDKEIFLLLQNFIFTLNLQAQALKMPSHIHIGLDWTCPSHLKTKKAVLGTALKNYTYQECQAEMDILNKEFLSVMEQGDFNGRAFIYTIPEYTIDKNFNWNGKNTPDLWKLTQKYGLTVFRNNTSLQNTPTILIKSAAVINLPQLAYRATSENDFFEKLNNILTTVKELFTSRVCTTEYAESILGTSAYNNILIPYGMQECSQNLINESIVSSAGKTLAEKILMYIKENTSFIIENQYTKPLNFLFAEKDIELYDGIKHSGSNCGYYTSGTDLPHNTDFELFTAVKHHEQFAKIYSPDSPLYLHTGNQIKDWQSCKSIIKRIVTQYNIPSFTFSSSYSICKEHGYLFGNHEICPICNAQTEQYVRIAQNYELLDSFPDLQKEEIQKQLPLSTESSPSLFQDFTYELFTSKNCKKCPPVRQYISTKNIQGTEISVDTKKGLDIAAEKGVFMTPTVIFYTAQNKEAARIHTVDEIDAFLSYQGISTGASSSSALLS